MNGPFNYDVQIGDVPNINVNVSDYIHIDCGGSGTSNYEKLSNKPRINGFELVGDKSFYDLGLDDITNADIDNIIFGS